jgi:hypothetical protein
VEARRQDMPQEAADELVGEQRHHPVVSLGAVKAIFLPLEGGRRLIGAADPAAGRWVWWLTWNRGPTRYASPHEDGTSIRSRLTEKQSRAS